jgi:hypothetical protein
MSLDVAPIMMKMKMVMVRFGYGMKHPVTK